MGEPATDGGSGKRPAILRLHRLAGKEGAEPEPVTEGSQGTGRGRGAVGAAGGSGWAGGKGEIGGAPVKYGDPAFYAD